MATETLAELEKLLAELRGRYLSGDKTVENRLRAVSARIQQMRIEQNKEDESPTPSTSLIKRALAKARTSRRCCRG